MLRVLLLPWLAMLVSVSVADTPRDQARQRVIETFEVLDSVPVEVDPEVIDGPWREAPVDRMAYTYTFDELRENWDYFMRGLRIPYPSPEYLEKRAERFPHILQEMHHQDHDWEQHSLNVLEVWQAFFRGDFQRARELGIHYGGYAQVPGVFAQILHAVYIAETRTEMKIHLRDAMERIRHYGTSFPFLSREKEFLDDYVMMRLGMSYAVGRLAEDEPVARTLAAGYVPMMINTAVEIMAVAPEHPVALALDAGFDAHVIRRLGEGIGRVTFGAQPINARRHFEQALETVDDMAVLHYEFANSLLYMDSDTHAEEALEHLEIAVNLEPAFAMEELDILHAEKRLEEVRHWKESNGGNYRSFDRKRRRAMRSEDENAYSVFHEPFTP